MPQRSAAGSLSPRLCAAILGLLLPCRLGAEQLPFRHYGSAEGVAETLVARIYQDHKGHLWFVGNDGLYRFDGDQFYRYGTRDGLGSPLATSVAEDADGRLWVGTRAGLARLLEEPPSDATPRDDSGRRLLFETLNVGRSKESNRIDALVFDDEGRLWCLTHAGLYRGDPVSLRFAAILPHPSNTTDPPLLHDSRGRVWASILDGVALVEGDRITRWTPAEPAGTHTVRALVEDSRGRIVAGHRFGLSEYVPPTAPGRRGSWTPLPLSLVPSQEIHSMWAAPDGALWIGTTHGLIEYRGGRQALYTAAHGLHNDFIWAVTGDRDGNLWIGTWAGLAMLPANSPMSWTRADGLPDPAVNLVIPSRDGRLYVRTQRQGLAEVVGGRVEPIRRSRDPQFQAEMHRFSTQVLQDRRGDWWVATRNALYRFQGPVLQLDVGHRFTAADGIPEDTRFGGWLSGIHEDALGRIWVASWGGLFRHDPARTTGTFFEFLPLDGFDADDGASDIVSDSSGAVWFRTHRNTVRVVGDRLERLRPTEGLPTTEASFIFVDGRDRLWIGTGTVGVSMARNPRSRAPRWTHYSTADGLSNDFVMTAAQDQLGNLYLGTPRGLDRLDPETGRFRQFTVRDGLAGGHVTHLRLDGRGYLWIATQTGLTRFDPRAAPPAAPPPPVQLTGVRLDGETLRLPERGVHDIPQLRLGASLKSLQVDFLALTFRSEGAQLYQYRLEGIDSGWSPPSPQRSVHYGRLAPGSYRFRVRAVTPDGQAGAAPASLAFSIASPWWHRWWFFVAVALILATAVEALHRLRLRRRLELEAIRTRIATDLHDDIGSNLSRIAILSEVARRDLDGGSPEAGDRLSRIASVSRELVDSMGDIVWAIHPGRDRLHDLTRRMRRFADDVLSARDIALRFRGPSDGHSVLLGPDTRREVFLVFKEAVNNVARHSGCQAVEIDLGLDDSWLALRVSDDGRGFDPRRLDDRLDGNGLSSMQRRAERLGGSLGVTTRPGEGTTLVLRVPHGPSRAPGRRGRSMASSR